MLQQRSIIIFIVVLALFGVFSQQAFAYHETLNVEYPRVPVPGGSFDMNKFLEKEHVLRDQGREDESQLTLGVVIVFIFIFLIWVSGFVLLGSLIYTGIIYVTSGSNPGRRAKARDRLTNVFWGISILLFAYIILFIVSPDIRRLQVTGMNQVGTGEAGTPSGKTESNSGPSDIYESCTSFEDTTWQETSNTCVWNNGLVESEAQEFCDWCINEEGGTTCEENPNVVNSEDTRQCSFSESAPEESPDDMPEDFYDTMFNTCSNTCGPLNTNGNDINSVECERPNNYDDLADDNDCAEAFIDQCDSYGSSTELTETTISDGVVYTCTWP